MIHEIPLRRRDDLTFKANLRDSRHGWIRLTPAYSVHLVAEILDAERPEGGLVLDPFCGTGTTALVCAERGIAAETTDINPFLIWLAQAKARGMTLPALTALATRCSARDRRRSCCGWLPARSSSSRRS